jgi:hypothetical protein
VAKRVIFITCDPHHEIFNVQKIQILREISENSLQPSSLTDSQAPSIVLDLTDQKVVVRVLHVRKHELQETAWDINNI